METAIVKLLTDDTPVSAIIGDRTFPLRIPQGKALPAVTYQLAVNNPTDTKDGPSKMDIQKLDIDLWGRSYSELKDLETKIRDVLDRFSGTVLGIKIQSIRFVTERDAFSNDAEMFHRVAEYSIREAL